MGDRTHTKQKPIKSFPRAISIAAKYTEKSKYERRKKHVYIKIQDKRKKKNSYRRRVCIVCGFAITTCRFTCAVSPIWT